MRFSTPGFMFRSLMPVLMTGAILQGCQESTAEFSPADIVQTVKLETVDSEQLTGQRRFVGRVEALSTVDLAFQVGGRVVSIPVQEGSRVAEGEVIASLDKRDYERAANEARVALELAQLDHQRNQQMLERGAIPRATYDRVAADLEIRQLAVEQAERNLAYATLEAPFDALITRRIVDPFTQVQAGSQIVRVQDVTELRISFSIPENLMSDMQLRGQLDVEAELNARPGQAFKLSYREHATEADPVTQTYKVDYALPDDMAEGILPGMTATVTVTAPNRSLQQVSVPVAALDTDPAGDFRVWIYQADTQTVSPQIVSVGELGSSRATVTSGLTGGEQIVTAGAHLLRNDMRVQPYTPNI
ncbi:hemolysin secretion protein D [Pseudohongiella nitratireducens]|uniref:Hemolysin secretion protein D n=1 Tax=Pseudohongiella nitratireducens TaxID=1768907 RepID=A0A916VKU7_9GAMM|nr:efflux RND transporter periplasmic adaptor subunit [Pseudohongiella nitratireducens]MDF1622707.1 efflux RND transporter periplasmic adaptor subunit [Pseudohongiella nitratireducens]GFZ82609.1 hemolysin secretion protein D [Pseudohongiella nitratireducens]|tara:strand:- start:7483 stop:8562 length:1080 start_codon:yes stop_codon:yes gene_type:complete